MKPKVEVEQEKDGRWIAEIRDLPGCMTYGKSPQDALDNVRALALRVLADGQAGWIVKKQHGILRKFLSANQLAENEYHPATGEKIGPRMLTRIAVRTGIKIEPE